MNACIHRIDKSREWRMRISRRKAIRVEEISFGLKDHQTKVKLDAYN